METPKEVVEDLEKGKPGQRFERLYRMRQRSRHARLNNALVIAAGVLVIAAGVVTYPIPIIPSEILILVGIVLLSQGSRWGARALDRAELWFRRHFAWLIAKWRRLPRIARWVIYLVWLAIIGAAGYSAYHALR